MAENNKLPKLNIMIVGKTGVGKSTLLNSLFGENLALTGSGEPITEKSISLRRRASQFPSTIPLAWSWMENIQQRIC